MKSIISILLILLTIALSACGAPSATTSIIPSPSFPSLSTNENSDSFKEPTNNAVSNSQTSASFSEIKPSLSPSNPVVSEEPTSESVPSVDTDDLIEALEEIIEKDVEDTLNELEDEWKTLEATVTSYENYVEQSEKVENFYVKIEDSTENLCIRLHNYSLQYAELILSSKESYDKKYDLFGELLDCIYEKATDDICDEIYDGILDDMGDAFYDGILDDMPDDISYRDWSDTRSYEYSWWSTARSNTYANYSDARSNIYRFEDAMRSAMYNCNSEKAIIALEKFRKTVNKLNTNNEPVAVEKYNTIDDLEKAIETDIENTVTALEKEWVTLKKSTTTYTEYIGNADKIEALYEKIETNTNQACIRLYLYTYQYANLIMDSNNSFEKKYDLFDDALDCIYSDACDEIYDEIYNGILNEMSDSFYNGILSEEEDSVSYEEWAAVSSNEYRNLSNSETKVYRSYSNATENIYRFLSNISNDMYNEDSERASIRLENFKEDLERLNH